MSDIKVVWDNENGFGDWALVGSRLAEGDDLASSILDSIFTDRQAEADDVIPDGTGDRRGWWADPTFGSRLWLLDRSKQVDDTLKRAKDYCEEALQWLLDDEVVASIDVETSFPQPGMLGIVLTVRKQDGTLQSFEFDWVWTGV